MFPTPKKRATKHQPRQIRQGRGVIDRPQRIDRQQANRQKNLGEIKGKGLTCQRQSPQNPTDRGIVGLQVIELVIPNSAEDGDQSHGERRRKEGATGFRSFQPIRPRFHQASSRITSGNKTTESLQSRAITKRTKASQ